MEDFSEKVAGLSESELNEYIVNRYKYIPGIVEASVIELQKRGRVFSAEELEAIRKDIEPETEISNQPAENPSVNPYPETAARVVDANAPEFYSRQVIRIFSFLFSTFFGSILMAMNLWRTPYRKGIFEVLAFGFLYTLAVVVLVSRVPGSSSFGTILNFAGGILIEFLFWNKFIGAETVYRKRSFWPPALIGLAICGLYLYALLSSGIRP